MDKKEYGEKIVNEIINDYKLSKEFHDDAVDHVWKEIFNKLNEIGSQLGHDFCYNKTIDQDEFLKGMEKNIHYREILDELMLIAFNKITNAKLGQDYNEIKQRI